MSSKSETFNFEKNLNKATYSGYLIAFYLCQLFEFELKILLNICISAIKISLKTNQIKYEPLIPKNIGLKDLLNRLATFFPKYKYLDFHKNVNQAIENRNKFIHETFKFNNDNLILPNTKKNYFDFIFINEKSIKSMFKWTDSYKKASNEIWKLISIFGSDKLKRKIYEFIEK
jgi:hypothetical protein